MTSYNSRIIFSVVFALSLFSPHYINASTFGLAQFNNLGKELLELRDTLGKDISEKLPALPEEPIPVYVGGDEPVLETVSTEPMFWLTVLQQLPSR